jgi:transposase
MEEAGAGGTAHVFSERRARLAQDEDTLKAQLYQQIGQLKVELDWLTQKAGLLG